MNRIILLTTIVVMFVISGCDNRIIDSKKKFNNLHWMEGKWVSTDVTNYSEIWKRINDTCYDGLSISHVDSDSLVEEREQIVLRNNAIHFINEIEEQTEEGVKQDYELNSNTPDTLVFFNNGMVYPNRITYKKINDTLMKVYIERKGGEDQIKFEYTLKKIK
jgi:hypothetical protein